MKLENALWHYALRLYSQDGVEQACLTLQAAGLSINRLLLCCWLGQEAGRKLALDQLEAATTWQTDITHPMRALRYAVRPQKQQDDSYQAVYAAMRKAELACEQVELALMCDAAETMEQAETGVDLLLENLACYLNACTLKQTIPAVDALETVLWTVYPALPENWKTGLPLH